MTTARPTTITTEIRVATRADVPLIQRFVEELAASIGRPDAIKGRAANLERFGFGEQPRFTALIARQAGKDVGLLLYFVEYSTWRGNPGLYVQDLYVSASARGSGAAQALIARARQDCRAIGGTYLRLAATRDNHAAHRFYLANGFSDVDDERLFVLEGPDFAAP